MGLDQLQSGGGFRPRVLDSSCNADNVSKLCQEGRLKEALHMVDLMVQQNNKAPTKTYVVLLKCCARRKALVEGKRVHSLILQSRLNLNTFLANTIIDMYAKCGSVVDAHKVFNTMSEHNVFSWTAIISAYTNRGRGKEAINLFQEMQQTCIAPDKVAFVVVLKACARIASLEQGKQLHSDIKESGLELDVFVGSALVDMYIKCGSIDHARQLFNKMSERNVVTWSAMISGYTKNGLGEEALSLYEQMKQEAVQPNVVTCVALLKACASIADLEHGKQIHSLIIKSGFQSDLIVGSALLDMYAKCGSVLDARNVFDTMPEHNTISWTAIISAYVDHSQPQEAIYLFQQMKQTGIVPDKVAFVVVLKACAKIAALEQGKQLHSDIIKRGFAADVVISNTLVDMYAKCGCIELASQVFNRMSERDVVSWNAMVAGYAQNGHLKQALTLYAEMKLDGLQPNNVTYVVLLKACASVSALGWGKQLHSHINRGGFESDMTIGNTLVDMYAKCGCIEHARQVFDRMNDRDVVSWNVLILGYAQQGLGKEALILLKQMQREGIKADEVTFVSVLSACSHSGLVDEGCQIFDSMCKDHGVTPNMKHYACMVDLLGRSGCLAEAEDFIRKMPKQPNSVVWNTLLGAARNLGHVGVGMHAFDCVVKMEPQKTAAYVLLSNIYAGAGTCLCTQTTLQLQD